MLRRTRHHEDLLGGQIATDEADLTELHETDAVAFSARAGLAETIGTFGFCHC